MDIDLSGIKLRPAAETRQSDPEEIFKRLTLRGSIENIWQPQTEAVKEWYAARTTSEDVGIEMHTGGGKTLVGLLVGQASVNEMRRPGFYVCPTIQLVEQTRARAAECGIETATYVNRRWEDRAVFDAARGLCITTYAAVFNSRARLAQEAGYPSIFVFDDAHVAGEEIRKQFTLSIGSNHPAYQPIIDQVRRHFTGAHEAAKLNAIGRGDPLVLLYLPQFEMRRIAGVLSALLVRHGVDTRGAPTWYPWGHIGTRLDACCMLLTAGGIEITPPVPPVHTVWCMGSGIRRVYLTATLPSAAEFARTFGLPQLRLIRPGGKSGTAQRLFIFAPGENNLEQRGFSLDLLDKQKYAVIAPSFKEAEPWQEGAILFKREHRNDVIEQFAKSPSPERLVLAARYHGIDLPGDACRILVLDGLPRGTDLLDRFLAEGLQAEPLRTMQTAVRVIQAIGRIFRSNTDHGAVVICGSDLQAWLHQPMHQAFFPPLLQQQLRLGIALRESVDAGQTTFRALLAGVLTGSKSWDQLYNQYIDAYAAEPPPPVPAWLTDFSAREHAAYRLLWEGNGPEAARGYEALAQEADEHDQNLAAWFYHWAGAAHEEAGQPELATLVYVEAANRRAALGRPARDAAGVLKTKNVQKPSAQAQAIAAEWAKDPTRVAGKVRAIADVLAREKLKASPAHEALEGLGRYLGFTSWRPDTPAAGKTGPDVAWRPPVGKGVVGLEAKTEKRAPAEYRKKDDVGQAHDHVEWATQFAGEPFYPIWVGPLLPVSKESHPPKALRVVEPIAFSELATRLVMVYEQLAAGTGEPPEITAERYLIALGLQWPGCVLSLPSTFATDLQHDPSGQEQEVAESKDVLTNGQTVTGTPEF
ncbi:MAG: DEAD/DEAH box helicase family protein [Longimicrobiaceae bacterium]